MNNDFIRTYHGVIDDKKCAELIEKFEQDVENHKVQQTYEPLEPSNRNVTENPYLPFGATLTQIHLLHSPDTLWKDDAKFLIDRIMAQVEKYKKDVSLEPYQWPEKFSIEPPKMKRYLPNTLDQFPIHVDVMNYKTARRFLVAFLYLDDNVRGETRFPLQDTEVSCTKGSLVLFPPLWPWIHSGAQPVDKPKYIIGTYLHYV